MGLIERPAGWFPLPQPQPLSAYVDEGDAATRSYRGLSRLAQGCQALLPHSGAWREARVGAQSPRPSSAW